MRVQIGGSDQWGNITAGTDLIRRLLGGGGGGGASGSSEGGEQQQQGEALSCFGLTFPLLVRGALPVVCRRLVPASYGHTARLPPQPPAPCWLTAFQNAHTPPPHPRPAGGL